MIQVDLPMPEACDVCPFNYDFCYCKAIDDNAWVKVKNDWNLNVCERNDRPDYCPLMEVKPNDAERILQEVRCLILHRLQRDI